MNNIGRQIRHLNSIFPWVRKRAQNNLVEIGLPAVKEIITALDTRYVPILTEGYDSRKDSFLELNRAVQRHSLLLNTLIKIGKPAIVELESALSHPNPNVRVSAITVLGIIHPSPIDLLFPLLDSSQTEERQYAISALGRTRSPRVLKRIIAAVDDENVYVRESALVELGNFGSMSILPKLEQIAQTDKTLVENYGRTIGHVAKEAIEKIHKRNSE